MYRHLIPALLALLALAGCAGPRQGDQTLDLAEATAVNATQLELEGDNLAQLGRYEEAFVKYGHVLAAEPDNHLVRLKKGHILIRRGLPDQAVAEFLALLKAKPGDNIAAMADLGAGQSLFIAGLNLQAMEHFKRALAADSTLWKAQAYLGVIHNREGHYEAAEQAFKAALALRPNSPEVLNDLGLTYAMTNRYEEAVVAYRRALAAGAEREKVSNNLGLALYRLGRLDEALEALRLGPTREDQARAYNNLGYCLLLDGDNQRAVEFLEKAMELHPAFYVHAHENLLRARTALALQADTGRQVVADQPRYTLLLGAYETQDQARSRQESLAQLGLDSRVVRGKPGLGHPPVQVVNGSFDSLERAKAERLRLLQEYGLGDVSVLPL